ncbi:MAG: hypothetical protein GY859_16090 [Desulfobacterales bacterium]|nr:hypothetical protein [Desulfobacterales bacterium]
MERIKERIMERIKGQAESGSAFRPRPLRATKNSELKKRSYVSFTFLMDWGAGFRRGIGIFGIGFSAGSMAR